MDDLHSYVCCFPAEVLQPTLEGKPGCPGLALTTTSMVDRFEDSMTQNISCVMNRLVFKGEYLPKSLCVFERRNYSPSRLANSFSGH